MLYHEAQTLILKARKPILSGLFALYLMLRFDYKSRKIMNSSYKQGDYAQGTKKLLSEDIRVVDNKLIITTNALDRELEVDLDLIENMIKESKIKSA